MHVQFLMFHNLVRNTWVCDDEVQKILVLQLPLGVKKEVEKWRMASGMLVERPQEVPKYLGKEKGSKWLIERL
jgi:xeroderma pigmentosum group C-complementing protein